MLQLTTGGCALFRRIMGVDSSPFRVAGDSLHLGWNGFLGLPARSRYTVRGDTLQLDFLYADGAAPQPVQLRFVRSRPEIMDPHARCAPSKG